MQGYLPPNCALQTGLWSNLSNPFEWKDFTISSFFHRTFWEKCSRSSRLKHLAIELCCWGEGMGDENLNQNNYRTHENFLIPFLSRNWMAIFENMWIFSDFFVFLCTQQNKSKLNWLKTFRWCRFAGNLEWNLNLSNN